MRKLLIPVLMLAMISAGSAISLNLASAATAHPSYALGKAKHCKVNFVKKTATHKVKGKSVRYVECIYKAPAKPRAAIDPAFTQNPSNPLEVTFSYSASETDGQLANGVLDLFAGPTSATQTLACSMNVGGTVFGGNCVVTFASYGNEVITVQYLSGTESATSSETDDIEDTNPASPTTTTLAPVGNTGTDTVTSPPPSGGGGGGGGGGGTPPPPPPVNVWGTTAPTGSPTVSVLTVGSGIASVSLSDANFEGATSVNLTDQLNDTCSAPVSGTTATCTMTITGTPNAMTIDYPGGNSGWAAETVQATPAVAGRVDWDGGSATGYGSWTSEPPSNLLELSPGDSLSLNATVEGAPDDPTPAGTLTFTANGAPMNGGGTSPNCSGLSTGGNASATCAFTIPAGWAGSDFVISVTYASTDSNYPSGSIASTVEVDVS